MFLQEKIVEIDLKAPIIGNPEGHIIDSKGRVPGLGTVATVLVSRGKLRSGQTLIAGANVAKVKALYDENMKKLKEVKPGQFAQLTGFKVGLNISVSFLKPFPISS